VIYAPDAFHCQETEQAGVRRSQAPVRDGERKTRRLWRSR